MLSKQLALENENESLRPEELAKMQAREKVFGAEIESQKYSVTETQAQFVPIRPRSKALYRLITVILRL